MRHGQGIMRYPQGYYYKGEFSEDLRSGIGLIIYKTDFFFQGTFFKDSNEGPGILVRKNLLSTDKDSKFERPDSPTDIFKSKNNDGYRIKKEIGLIDEFIHFRNLPLDITDLIFVTLTSEQLENRIINPHPKIESGSFRAGKLQG